LDTLLALVLELTEQQPVVLLVEDLHWSDPSTVKLLSLLIDHGATARLLMLLTCRPAFQPPWSSQAHVTSVKLQRIPQHQVQQMVMGVTEGLALPSDLLRHIIAKTDGVPLFVEELTKMVLESGFLRQAHRQYELTGPWPSQAIPATLHDALMTRLDRLDSAKGVAQVGAVLGRSFSYELLRVVTPVDEAVLPRELGRQAAQIDAGLTVVAEALGLVEQHGERFGEAELYRLKGELLLRQATPDEPGAETCWQQALAIAHRQQAKSLELRVAMSLSRLWQQRGKQDVARQVLAAPYGWFIQGLDTRDLQEAKALLEAFA
jgi:predicted ATPase